MRRYRIVIDTNVIVSAMRSRKGASFRLLSMLLESASDFLISTPLVLEYEMVLKRSNMAFLPESEVERLVDDLCLMGVRQTTWYLWRPILNDPDDDFIAELAANGQADFVVTYNRRDFEQLRLFGIATKSPKEFLELLRQVS